MALELKAKFIVCRERGVQRNFDSWKHRFINRKITRQALSKNIFFSISDFLEGHSVHVSTKLFHNQLHECEIQFTK